jgi:hypothetical protein
LPSGVVSASIQAPPKTRREKQIQSKTKRKKLGLSTLDPVLGIVWWRIEFLLWDGPWFLFLGSYASDLTETSGQVLALAPATSDRLSPVPAG